MAAALAFGVPSLVAAGHHKHTPWWAVAGIVLAAIFFLAGVLFFVSPWLGRLSRRFGHLPPLVLTVEDEEWFPFRRVGYVCAFLIKIKNTSNQPVAVGSYGIGTDWSAAPGAAQVTISADDARDLTEQARVRREGGRYDPLLHARSDDVPPHGEISGWLVTHTARPGTGGRPRCTIQVTDKFGNTYTKVIEQRDPQHYKS
jgi:hypothetical protein